MVLEEGYRRVTDTPNFSSCRHRQAEPSLPYIQILSHDAITFCWRWAWRRSVLTTTVRLLRWLELNTIGLAVAVIRIVCAAIVASIRVWLCAIRGCGCLIVVVASVVGLCGVVARPRCPASAVEWLATSLAATACCYAAAKDKEEEESNYDDGEDNPADPAIPCTSVAAHSVEAIAITSSHGVLD